MKLEDFVFPYGKLNPENEQVKLSELIPWDRIEVVRRMQTNPP